MFLSKSTPVLDFIARRLIVVRIHWHIGAKISFSCCWLNEKRRKSNSFSGCCTLCALTFYSILFSVLFCRGSCYSYYITTQQKKVFSPPFFCRILKRREGEAFSFVVSRGCAWYQDQHHHDTKLNYSLNSLIVVCRVGKRFTEAVDACPPPKFLSFVFSFVIIFSRSQFNSTPPTPFVRFCTTLTSSSQLVIIVIVMCKFTIDILCPSFPFFHWSEKSQLDAILPQTLLLMQKYWNQMMNELFWENRGWGIGWKSEGRIPPLPVSFFHSSVRWKGKEKLSLSTVCIIITTKWADRELVDFLIRNVPLPPRTASAAAAAAALTVDNTNTDGRSDGRTEYKEEGRRRGGGGWLISQSKFPNWFDPSFCLSHCIFRDFIRKEWGSAGGRSAAGPFVHVITPPSIVS